LEKYDVCGVRGEKFCRGKGGAGTVCLLENVAAVSSNQNFEELYVARDASSFTY